MKHRFHFEKTNLRFTESTEVQIKQIQQLKLKKI